MPFPGWALDCSREEHFWAVGIWEQAGSTLPARRVLPALGSLECWEGSYWREYGAVHIRSGPYTSDRGPVVRGGDLPERVRGSVVSPLSPLMMGTGSLMLELGILSHPSGSI